LRVTLGIGGGGGWGGFVTMALYSKKGENVM
jgi:hypothetical protein